MSNRSISHDEDATIVRDDPAALRDLLDASPAGILWFDPETRLVTANQEAARLHGFASVSELVSQGWSAIDFVAPADRAAVEALGSLGEQGITRRRTMRLLRKDGTTFLADVEVAPMLDSLGRPRGFVGVSRDITELRQEVEELRREKLESLSLLAGGIAHDFNNVLTGILGNIGLARMNAGNPDAVRLRLGEAELAIRRARDLTQQLLTFSKGASIQPKNVDVRALLEEAVPFALRGSSVGFELNIEGDGLTVHADEGQLTQVIHNLIINAAQAMPSGGMVRVGAHKIEDAGPWIEVTVRDSGDGIDDRDLARVFDPYFTTKCKGHGLGLATSHAIIQRHGGRVELTSKRGEGTVVRFRLESSDGPVSHREEACEGEPRRSVQGHRILLMDDDPIVLDVLEIMLRQLGYRTTCTTNGQDAIAAYHRAVTESDEYDAVLVDLTIQGGMGGQEALSQLKLIDPKVRAIVSSGYPDDPIMRSPRDYGFTLSVVKPFSIRDLQGALEKVTSSG